MEVVGGVGEGERGEDRVFGRGRGTSKKREVGIGRKGGDVWLD